ncbi:ComEC/Rec2 family competence protein [Neoehrlichia mikurensis]|uniref:ComEC family competence protein n=1 Tax=Neoehrlichia mikurensis TaxID=89586 RepID=A0A9Q9BSF7_9RICK|nr:ComEC/Rec2 family competence protein [Neoehrlichia mikurensis]QXK91815.1 ComEC/Rec2 family competence protein [Neoehrlichia mikurensis]QXK93028.1 ComEC/Rec2 family competence protein [Neoehrlichia mikurensis]QXK93506.1 ComEC/Rec2 family competence protein [Neoehrlichia mikurensis]UTO55540.1 ComEC family competence protein [Neoehrlichia mikurensis]UTO56461.1 ComEC family competence protein [Neoehrlichia mikurensis]
MTSLYKIKRIVNFIAESFVISKGSFIIFIPLFQGIGILLYFCLNYEPNKYFIAVLIFIEVVLIVLIVLLKQRYVFILVFMLLFGFIGIYFRVIYVATDILEHKVYVNYVIGTIKEMDYQPLHVRLLLCNIENVSYKIDCIRLVVRTKIDKTVKIGDKVSFSGVLYPPFISASKYDYDFSKVAYFSNISALGFTTSRVKIYLQQKKMVFSDYIERLRMNIYYRLSNGLKKDYCEIMSALLIGKRLGIKNSTMIDIRNAGLSHLFAISGLHLSFIAGLLFRIVRNILVLSEVVALKFNIKKIASVIGIMSSFIYLVIAGAPISAQRAFVMVSLVFVGIIIDREHNSLCSIAIAAFLILLFKPESLLFPSFQMSFIAVMSLVVNCDIFSKIAMSNNFANYFLSIILSSFIVSIASAPYVIYHFHCFSIGGLLANVIAIPLTTFIIIPFGVLYLFISGLSFKFFIPDIIEKSVSIVLFIANYISNIKVLIINCHSFSPSAILIITCGIIFLCLWKSRIRLYGIVFIVLGALIGIYYNTPDLLFTSNDIVVKEGDGKLYSIFRNHNIKSFISLSWSRQNGQVKIYKKNYVGKNKRLFCEHNRGCIYIKFEKKILIANNANYILDYCNNVDFIIQISDFVYPNECNTKYISNKKLQEYGVHYVWVDKSNIKIDNSYDHRPWHNIVHS